MSAVAVAENQEVVMTVELLQRIVQLKVANVPDWQISKGFGFEEGILSELYKTDEYQAEFSKYFQDQIKNLDEVNQGWDGIERKSIQRLNDMLNRPGLLDPDFALKLAVMANKAQRRPLVGNKPIDAANGGTAVIYIAGNFINKMQNMQINERDHENDGGAKKQNDFIDPNQVESVLLEGKSIEKTIDQQISDLLGDPVELLK